MPSLLLISAALTATVLITPTELREQLAQPTALRYQQLLQQLVPDSQQTLEQLRRDPQLSPAAREWLLHAAAVALRQQTPTPATRQWLQSLQAYPSQVLLPQDFEGRSRALPLAPVALAAQATLNWWQQQEQAERIRQQLTIDTLAATAAQWSTLAPQEQAAWQLALQQPPPDLAARLAGLDREPLARLAPALAATLARQLRDPLLARAVLQADNSELASQLLSDVPQHFDRTDQLAIYRSALSNSTLRSQSWFQVAKLDEPAAQSALTRAVELGERAAIAAWLHAQGDAALPTLQHWLRSKNEPRELSAVYGLRLLATPAAKQVLLQAKRERTVSARAQQELQP